MTRLIYEVRNSIPVPGSRLKLPTTWMLLWWPANASVDSRFSTGDALHVIHITVKPQDVIDEEDARIAKGGSRERDGSERSPRCRCIVM